MTHWREIAVDPPEPYVDVLVFVPRGGAWGTEPTVRTAQLIPEFGFGCIPTHWMPLPAHPVTS